MIRRHLMRGALLLAGACLAFHGSTTHAAPIKGKFGLGVDTGELLSSSAEGALILGKSERRAWLWVIAANGNTTSGSQLIDYYYPDTLLTRDIDNSGFSLGVGPGLRTFFRESGHLSPYFDLVTQFLFSHGTFHSGAGTQSAGGSETTVGGQLDLAVGAEYFFERWPVSLAAHTRLMSLRYQHHTHKDSRGPDRAEATSDQFSASEGLGPRLQLRVYF